MQCIQCAHYPSNDFASPCNELVDCLPTKCRAVLQVLCCLRCNTALHSLFALSATSIHMCVYWVGVWF